MTKEDAITHIEEWMKDEYALNEKDRIVLKMSLKALKQEPFINKPCISEGVCEHDKMQALDNVRAEIEQIEINGHIKDVECFRAGINTALNVINKYKAKSEE